MNQMGAQKMPSKSPKKKSNEPNQDFFKRCINSLTKQGLTVRQAASQCSAQFEEKNLIGNVQQLSAILDLEVDDQDSPRSFIISAKTGDPVETYYGMKLVIAIDGIRFQQKMPVLRSHDRDRIVGHGQGFIDGSTMLVEGEFSKSTSDAQEVLALADEGFPWQASIGVWAEEITYLETGSKKTVNGQVIEGPAEIWGKSYVREVSFTPIGADDRTAAIALDELLGNSSRAQDSTSSNIQLIQQEKKPMDLEQFKTDHRELYDQIVEAAKAEGIALGIGQERSRVLEIFEAEASGDATLTAIKNGLEAGDAYKEFYLAEKMNRQNKLNELEQDATPPQGQDENGDGSGDQEKLGFMALMKELQAKEKISTVAAMKKAVRLYPAEHKAFLLENKKNRDDGRD
jgi:hypothetical protein